MTSIYDNVSVEEFIPKLTSEHPELTRRYIDFDWTKLLTAGRLRLCKTTDKHVKLGYIPEGISIEEYQQIWGVYSDIKRLLSGRKRKVTFYNKNKNDLQFNYRHLVDTGKINLEKECTRKKLELKNKKKKQELTDKLKSNAKLFGINPVSVDKMDMQGLSFYGQPIKNINIETSQVTYTNPCFLHYDPLSVSNLSLNMEDYVIST